MTKSLRVARGLPRALILLSFATVLVWLPASGSASRARVSTLNIDPIHADFNGDLKQTMYSVPNVSDPEATYQWTLIIAAPIGQVDPSKGVDPGCNNHGNLGGTGKTFVWKHGNKGDTTGHDDGCDHDLQGQWGHQGLITVVVSDAEGDHCTATYKGTYGTDENAALGQNAASDRVCTQAPPPVSPPPPPPPGSGACRCVKVDRVRLASIDIEPPNLNGAKASGYWQATLTFSAEFECGIAGSGSSKISDCSVKVEVQPQASTDLRNKYTGHASATFFCDPRCEGPRVESYTQTQEVHFRSEHDLSKTGRAGRTFLFGLAIECLRAAGVKTTHERVRIVFDEHGNVDRAKSDFNADGKPDHK
jgi:hypothetical protein